ncbi:MAG TPA: bifunctional alpha,alpha-trehalose-phosphate synthase (UDP-forming)/trehalose-phosphatase, partial [Candidatus Polarisedimenticolaceae bacterium]|nr:bifunctional alpha,alpha-trehalose-phosphate synthase (UDP-forming)/trehalose-phosphatase [Candidatus Polarisedimenticolaceae bacterium]
GGLWFGWRGNVQPFDAAQRERLDRDLLAKGLVPVDLTAEEVDGFYKRFSNGVLWPLFHYSMDRIPRDPQDWDVYQHVNRRFAEVVAAQIRPGDLVWVHDYQLALVPRFLRQLAPEVKIGFFLHIPFPSSEVFRVLPWRAAWLEGVLGADLVAFHTLGYLRHFSASLLRVLGLEAELDHLWLEGRKVRLAVCPMGVDAGKLEELALAVRPRVGGPKLLLGVDRLDYTKGIPRRLLAVEMLLEKRIDLHGTVQVIQIAVPSREDVPAYGLYKRELDELVGRINGRFGTPAWTPIRYVHRRFDQAELAHYYRSADVMLVTPLRDGMNLVAKEFVASRPDGDGVLVLSELAGAAVELGEAVLVNPYDVSGMAEKIGEALAMPEAERRRRMAALRERVITSDVHAWASTFLEQLAATPTPQPPRPLSEVIERAQRVPLILLLDYDGTLVPFHTLPEQAAPTSELVDLLKRLAARPATAVHLVSGRTRDSLEGWFGDLPIALHAEHGAWSRLPQGLWRWHGANGSSWLPRIRPLVEEFVRSTPGAFIEWKHGGLACHYRAAEPGAAAQHARELRGHLLDLLSNAPVRVTGGSAVLEIRTHGLTKGRVVRDALRWSMRHAVMLALGDDPTDEDLFAELPANGIAVHVGGGPTRAPWNVPDWRAARELLEALARSPGVVVEPT